MRGFVLRILVPVGVVLIGVLITLSIAGAFGGSSTSRNRQTAALGVAAPSSGFTSHVQVIPPPKGSPAAARTSTVPANARPAPAGPTGPTGATGAVGAPGASGGAGTTKIQPKPVAVAKVPAKHTKPVTPPVHATPVTTPARHPAALTPSPRPVVVVKPTPRPVVKPTPKPVVRPKPKPVPIPVIEPLVITDPTPPPPPAASATKPSPISGPPGLQAPGG